MQYSHRILIVEDQPEVARLLNSAIMTLERNLGLINILSGEEAILDAMKNQVDLMVIDYRLPGINGLELLKKVRKIKPLLKGIMITGLTDPDVLQEIEEALPFSVFKKPVPIPDFLDAVVRALEPLSLSNSTDQDHFPIENEQELVDLFHELKEEFNAQAAIMFNDQGNIHVSISEIDEGLDENSLIEPLLPILNSVRNLNRINGNKEFTSWHIFSGGKYDMIFSQLDASHALVLTGVKKNPDQLIVKKIQEFLRTKHATNTQDIKFENSSKPQMDDVNNEELDQGNTDPMIEIQPIVENLQEKVPTDELNAFWDEAVETYTDSPSQPDDLSYEQAKELGLTPGDEQG
jgi:two-component system, response regulator, stage 0 sporulation protein F